MLVILLFALMLVVMLMRVRLVKGVTPRGKVLHEERLSFIERLLLQRVNLYAIGGVLALMTITGSISSGVEILVLLAAQVIVALPARYIVTSEGVALNNVLFRPWTDFAGFNVSARRISLAGKNGSRALNLVLLSDHQKDTVKVLRRHLPEIKARKEAGVEYGITTG